MVWMVRLDEKGCIQIPDTILKHLEWKKNGFLRLSVKKHVLYLENDSQPDFQKLYIQCFGSFSIEINGEEVSVKSKKMREFLAFLCVENGKIQNKECLARILWPDSSAVHARDCLYKLLKAFMLWNEEHHLPVKINRQGISITLESDQLDILQFEAVIHEVDVPDSIEKIMEIYRGHLLENECYDWSIFAQMKYEIQMERFFEKRK